LLPVEASDFSPALRKPNVPFCDGVEFRSVVPGPPLAGTPVVMVASVVPHVEPPPPRTATLMPHTRTGALIGALTVPPAGLVAPVVLAGQLDDESDPTPTVMPQAVTGAVTGAFAVLPDPSVVPLPLVEPLSPVPDVLLAVPAAAGQFDDASAAIPTVVPQTSTGALTGALASVPEAPEPVVLAEVSEPVPPLLVVPVPLPFCSTATVLPPTVTGAATGALAVVTPLSPVPAPLIAVPADAAGQFDDESDPTPTVLPQTSTGAVIGASAEVAEPPLSPVPAPLIAVPADEIPAGQFDDASDPTATVVPQTITGAVTGALASVPVVPDPVVLAEVVDPVLVPDDDPAPVLPLPAVPLTGWPTATVLPLMVTGTLTGAFAVLPVLDPAAVPVSVGQPAVGEDKMPIEVPQMVIGALIGAFTAGSDVAALAIPAPTNHRPPIRRPACTVRFTK
jgi:hypothetical protein